jgi:hypothetical protein
MTATPRYTLNVPIARVELRWLYEAARISGLAVEEHVRGELRLTREQEPIGRPHLRLVASANACASL